MKKTKWEVSKVQEKEPKKYYTKKMRITKLKKEWFSLLGMAIFCALMIYVPTVINDDIVRLNLENNRALAKSISTEQFRSNMEQLDTKFCVELTNEQVIIKEVADSREFKDIELLFCLAKHESNYDRYAVGVNIHKQSDGTILTSRDLGILQWNHHYHPNISKECKFDIACSVNEAITKINVEGGCNSWATCKYCK